MKRERVMEYKVHLLGVLLTFLVVVTCLAQGQIADKNKITKDDPGNTTLRSAFDDQVNEKYAVTRQNGDGELKRVVGVNQVGGTQKRSAVHGSDETSRRSKATKKSDESTGNAAAIKRTNDRIYRRFRRN